MRTLTVATGVNCAASSTSTPLDMEPTTQTTPRRPSFPFRPSSSLVAFVSLDGVTRCRIRLQESETASFPTTGTTTLLDENLTAQTTAQTRVAVQAVTLGKRYVRVTTTAATGATGRVSLSFLGT